MRSAWRCRSNRGRARLSDNEVAQAHLYTTLIFAPACILGGWLSDRFGRRSTLAIFVFLTVVPTLWLAWTMWQAGWIMPVDMKMANRPQPSTVLLVTFWATCIVYNVFQGLYYGIRSALFMDITTPAVAATQFTAYMALMNLCISYTAAWQGYAVERIGYPATLCSIACSHGRMLLLPLMAAARASDPAAKSGHVRAPPHLATRPPCVRPWSSPVPPVRRAPFASQVYALCEDSTAASPRLPRARLDRRMAEACSPRRRGFTLIGLSLAATSPSR